MSLISQEDVDWHRADSHVKKIDVMATAPEPGVLLLTVTLTLFDGSVLPMPFKTHLSRI